MLWLENLWICAVVICLPADSVLLEKKNHQKVESAKSIEVSVVFDSHSHSN